jgi:hypothetical protein
MAHIWNFQTTQSKYLNLGVSILSKAPFALQGILFTIKIRVIKRSLTGSNRAIHEASGTHEKNSFQAEIMITTYSTVKFALQALRASN